VDRERFGTEAVAVRDVGLRDARDREIFAAARKAKACVPTKDSDFVDLVKRIGPPPSVIWLRCGNTSNAQVQELLAKHLRRALMFVENGEPLVAITDSL